MTRLQPHPFAIRVPPLRQTASMGQREQRTSERRRAVAQAREERKEAGDVTATATARGREERRREERRGGQRRGEGAVTPQRAEESRGAAAERAFLWRCSRKSKLAISVPYATSAAEGRRLLAVRTLSAVTNAVCFCCRCQSPHLRSDAPSLDALRREERIEGGRQRRRIPLHSLIQSLSLTFLFFFFFVSVFGVSPRGRRTGGSRHQKKGAKAGASEKTLPQP